MFDFTAEKSVDYRKVFPISPSGRMKNKIDHVYWRYGFQYGTGCETS